MWDSWPATDCNLTHKWGGIKVRLGQVKGRFCSGGHRHEATSDKTNSQATKHGSNPTVRDHTPNQCLEM